VLIPSIVAGSPRQDGLQKLLNIRSSGWLSTAHRLHEQP
jgi:hypothetical protein